MNYKRDKTSQPGLNGLHFNIVEVKAVSNFRDFPLSYIVLSYVIILRVH